MLLRVLFAGATAACFAVCNCKLHGWVLTPECAERSQDTRGATCGVWLLAMLADVLPHVLLVRRTLLRAAMLLRRCCLCSFDHGIRAERVRTMAVPEVGVAQAQ